MFPPAPVLIPLSRVYGAVVRARGALYGAGLLKTHRVDAPVISVGNITAGGTGKTPLVAWVARALAREGVRACVLTRGYGRRDAGRRVVVSDGARLLADAAEGGDEPRLLAETLLDAGVAVVSDADRVAAARWAFRHLRSEAFVLDDGFQHLRIARRLDIVTIDAADPWGGRRLLPHGRLREPLSGLARADALVISRADLAADLAALRAEARRLTGGRAPVFVSRLRTTGLRPLAATYGRETRPGVEGSASAVGGVPQPLAAFCALGNPASFFAHLRREGYAVNHARAFRDHHSYTQADVDALAREATSRGARSLLTTAKDAVKLRGLEFPLPCFVCEVELEFEEEEALLAVVRSAVKNEEQ